MALMTSIGLMSGTSMDGIDVALIRSDGANNIERGPSMEIEYDVATRRAIEQGLVDALSISDDRDARPGDLAALELSITRLHADAVATFLSANNIASSEIDVIGFHGQTVLHRPQNKLTVQLGDGALLAAKTNIPVVHDMRAADMVANGQGAPLVPIYHQALASLLPKEFENNWPVAFVNIGGISNITFVPKNGPLVAFDTGPGNALIDQWVQSVAGIPFDQGGKIASEGGVEQVMLSRYLSANYFTKKLPKSLDRNDFQPPSPNEIELSDGARTLARLTAEAIFLASDLLPKKPTLWIICGGGRKNEVIMGDLAELAKQSASTVISAEQANFDGGAMEAEAFAYLAIRSLKKLPLTFPGTTGCDVPTSGGEYTPRTDEAGY